MSDIKEEIKVLAPVNVVWKAWSDNYLKMGLEIGKNGCVVADEKKKVKFKIQDFKENESLTIIWYSLMTKLIFYHEVAALNDGSLVTCKVKIKGFLSFLIKPLIAPKIRNYLQISLKQFSRTLNGI